MLQRIWSYKEKILDKKRNKMTDKMMRSILTLNGGNRDRYVPEFWTLKIKTG